MKQTYTKAEAINSIRGYLQYKGVKEEELDKDKIIRDIERIMKFKNEYMDLKETFNKDTLQMYITNILRFYLMDSDITTENKMEVTKELLEVIMDKE